MNTGRLARICVVLCSAAVIGAVPSTASSATSATQSAVVPSFAHVVVVVMENKSASSIIGNTSQASYINSLAGQYAYASNDFAVSHPSLPNYLALTGASTFGITSDCSPAVCPVNATNLMDRIESSGRSWKAYMESMPTSCATTDAYPYAVKHNPFVYYGDLAGNATRCSRVVPAGPSDQALLNDLDSVANASNYMWLTPDLCNDMHDCNVTTGDAFMSGLVPQILRFGQRDGALDRHRLAVDAVFGHRVVGVAGQDDARAHGDLLAGDPVRIAPAVPTLVLVAHDPGHAAIDAAALE